MAGGDPSPTPNRLPDQRPRTRRAAAAEAQALGGWGGREGLPGKVLRVSPGVLGGTPGEGPSGSAAVPASASVQDARGRGSAPLPLTPGGCFLSFLQSRTDGQTRAVGLPHAAAPRHTSCLSRQDVIAEPCLVIVRRWAFLSSLRDLAAFSGPAPLFLWPPGAGRERGPAAAPRGLWLKTTSPGGSGSHPSGSGSQAVLGTDSHCVVQPSR